jgi:ParB/RepB/Spo0J family partition protein
MAKILQGELERVFAGLIKKAPNPAAGDPTHHQHGPLEGRRKDDKSFLMETSRIQRKKDQVRQRETSRDDPRIQALARSLKQRGLINAIGVRWIADQGNWEVADGDGRFVAATEILKWKYVRVHLVEANDEELVFHQLHENIHRAGLHPLDLALALKSRIEQGMTATRIADELGTSLSYVTKALKVAENLTPQAREILQESPKGESLETVYEVAKLPKDQQIAVADEIKAKNLNQQDVRKLTAASRDADNNGRSARGRKAGTKPFSKTWKLTNGVEITAKASKSGVENGELLAAFQEVIAVVERGSQ